MMRQEAVEIQGSRSLFLEPCALTRTNVGPSRITSILSEHGTPSDPITLHQVLLQQYFNTGAKLLTHELLRNSVKPYPNHCTWKEVSLLRRKNNVNSCQVLYPEIGKNDDT